jgi:hypothetical protein
MLWIGAICGESDETGGARVFLCDVDEHGRSWFFPVVPVGLWIDDSRFFLVGVEREMEIDLQCNKSVSYI